MLKTALESKYIRLALAILTIVLVTVAVLVQTIGKERANLVDDGSLRGSLFEPKYVEIVHESGKYVLTGGRGEYCIRDPKDPVYYESEGEPVMLKREGYIRVRNEDSKACLINIYTGETVWKAKGEEYIDNYWDGFWVVEDMIKDEDSIFGTAIYYLLDDNFEVAAEGALFNYIRGNDSYITGQKYIDYTYYLRSNLAGKSFSQTKTENVVLKDGEVYFVSDSHIDHLDGNTAHMSNRTKDGKTHISLLPETLGEEMRGECYEDD